MKPEKNIVGWFEIPVNDMDRAIAFYEKVFNTSLLRNKIGNTDMAWFPYADEGIGSPGSLIYDPVTAKPGTEGVLIYFTTQAGDMAIELSRVEDAGGKVLQPKTLISPDIGYYGIFIDTEGNRLAIHSRK